MQKRVTKKRKYVRKQLPKKANRWQAQMHLMAAMKHACYAYHATDVKHGIRREQLHKIAKALVWEVTAQKYNRSRAPFSWMYSPIVESGSRESYKRAGYALEFRMLGSKDGPKHL